MSTAIYIPLLDWNESYDLSLGDVLFNIKNPKHVLLRLGDTQIALKGAARPKKPLGTIYKSWGDDKSHKLGLYAKVLEILGVGVNASHASASTYAETYDITSAESQTFTPTADFFEKIAAADEVASHLSGSEDARAFVVTGILTGTGITYEAKTTKEHNNEASMGIDAAGVSIGPKGRRAKKQLIHEKRTLPGPMQFAVRVSKVQLDVAGKGTGEEYTDGAKFGPGDDGVQLHSGIALDDIDQEDLAFGELLDENGNVNVLVAPAI